MSDKREADKIVRNQLPQLLNPHKKQKIKNSEDMTATADFKQTAQYIGLAICGLIMRTAFGVSGILWGRSREMVNGVFIIRTRPLLYFASNFLISVIIGQTIAMKIIKITDSKN